MTQLCRAKCFGCGNTFLTEVPICPNCQAHTITGHSGGTVAWVPYLIVPIQAGPFHTREERDRWYQNMHKTHPQLAGKRVDCFEEIVAEPGKPS